MNNYNKNLSEEVSVFDFFRIMLSQKNVIAKVTTVFIAISLIYALSATWWYEAKLVMVSAEQQNNTNSLGGLSGLASLAGVNISNSNNVDTSLAIIKSRDFISEFIEEEQVKQRLFEDLWDTQNNTWKKGEEPSSEKAFYKFESIITVNMDIETGIITLIIVWTDPKEASDWANKLVSKVNNRMRNQALQETERNIEFLNLQLQKTNIVNAQKAVANLIEEQTKNMMIANSREQYAFKVIDPAVIPEERIRPKRSIIMIVGTIFGFGLSLILAFVNFLREE